MKYLIFILFYTTAIQSQSFYRYEIIIDHMVTPKADALLDYGTLRVKKYNRTTFVLNGYVDILIPFSNEIIGQFDIFSYQGNEYRKMYGKKVTKMCTFLRQDKVIVAKTIDKTSLAPEIKSCPMPPQRLHFYDAYIPGDYLPLQPPNGEKYRLDLKYILNGTILTNNSYYILIKKMDNQGIGAIQKLG